jgi:non-ribosomal peptide synthetase component F
VVGILGVLKAGGAYVPLDPSYPPDRIASMIEDAGLALILTQAELQAGLAGPPTWFVWTGIGLRLPLVRRRVRRQQSLVIPWPM